VHFKGLISMRYRRTLTGMIEFEIRQNGMGLKISPLEPVSILESNADLIFNYFFKRVSDSHVELGPLLNHAGPALKFTECISPRQENWNVITNNLFNIRLRPPVLVPPDALAGEGD
jgi:hypothetical protein